MNATGVADVAMVYGVAGDTPASGDWDGDSADTIGIYRKNKFHLRNENTTGDADVVFALGVVGDMPIVGDWNGQP